MNPTNLFRSVVFSCILAAATLSLHAQTEDGKRLIALEKRRFDAMIHRDTTLLSSLLADSLAISIQAE